MKAYIITELKNRIIFPNGKYEEICLTFDEYNHLTGQNEKPFHKGTKICMSIDYKGFDNSKPCVNDFVGNKIKAIDLSKLTVSQIEKLLKL